MNGYNVTQVTATGDSTKGTVEEFHPGFTAAISFAAAILMVFVYLYYDNVLLCLKTLSFRRRPPDTASETTTEGASPKLKANEGDRCFNSEIIVPENTKSLIREPGVMCECGRIHLLKDCVKSEDLKPYEKLLSKIAAAAVPEAVSCKIIDETSNQSNTISNGKAMIANGIRNQRKTSQISPLEESTLQGTMNEAMGSPKTDSGDSSPKCVTPLIKVKPVKQTNRPAMEYAFAGARPKERTLKEAVS